MGCYEGLVKDDHACLLCNQHVEKELYVLLECPLYNAIRKGLFSKVAVKYNVVFSLAKYEQLKTILACNDEVIVKDYAKTCYDSLYMRRSTLHDI